MIIWLKRIGFIAGVVIMLEIVAWVGVYLFGTDAVSKLWDFYIPKEPTPVVRKDQGGWIEKCSTFDGEIFCIKERE